MTRLCALEAAEDRRGSGKVDHNSRPRTIKLVRSEGEL